VATLAAKKLVFIEIVRERVTAAAQARERLSSHIVIIARTDALQTDDFDEAVRRLKGAIGAGADVAFLEGTVVIQLRPVYSD
jgi:2-methylisocitrate lyase-like PEP mutase family enzyme